MREGMRRGQWLLAMLLGLLLAACGGGNGGGDAAPASTTSVLATLSGVAATGAAVQGIVTLRDVPTGKLQATHTDDGRYTFNVTGLAGPFLLRVVSDDRATTLYGVALKTGNDTRGHLNPLTNRIYAMLASSPYTGYLPRPLAFNASPGPFAELDADLLSYAAEEVLLRTSPQFRQRLQAHGVAEAGLDPVAGPFVIGQGLDLAFDDVKFFYDDTRGEAWEKLTATGAFVGAVSYFRGFDSPWAFHVGPEGGYLMPGTSQALTGQLEWGGWWSGYIMMPVRHGVRWTLSDDSLASIDENGVLTAKPFTGTHWLTVTGIYQYGDLLLEDSTTFTLVEQAPVANVSMSQLPDIMSSDYNHPLYTIAELTPEAGGGTLELHGGTWSLVDPDPHVQATVQLFNFSTGAAISFPGLLQDTEVRLRAVQTVAGQQYVSEKVVTLKKHVPLPVAFWLNCPASLSYEVASACTAHVDYDDGSSMEVEPALAVAGNDADYVTLNGTSLTSHWESRYNWSSVTVTGSYHGMTAVQTVSLNPRQLKVTGLEVVGVDEMPENASTRLQAVATWEDGSRTDVSSDVSWMSSDTAAANFGSYNDSYLRSNYLLGQQGDKVVTVTASICPTPRYGCASNLRFNITHPVTVRNASLTLVGLDLSGSVLGYGFAQQGQSHTLTARAVWNKKYPDGTPYTTAIASGVEWSSNNTAAAVSGDLLTVGSIGSEHLALITARYRDPGDTGVMRTARRVLALYSPLGTPRELSLNRGSATTYLLGGDGLARPLGPLPHPLYGRRVGAPVRFMTRVKQVAGTDHGLAYLRDDGTVWYPEPISNLPYSPEMRDELMRQADYYTQSVPRPIPGVSNVVQLVSTGESWLTGQLYALRADGSVLRIKLVPTPTGRSYSVSTVHTGVSRIASGSALLMVMQNGEVQQRTQPFNNTIAQIRKADGSVLTGITDVAAFMTESSAMALASDGTLWTWGNNYNGQLGLGDTTSRTYAAPITHVTGFSQLAGTMAAALRSDGTLWSWGMGSAPASTLPQQVSGFSGLTAINAGYVVAADGKVWWWGRDSSSYSLYSPLPVYVEGSTEGPQLTLP